MIDNKVVGQAISKLRQAENMTQQTLAACLNVSHQAVSKWENGAALPDVLTLLEISRMFGVTLEQLLAGDVGHRLHRDAPPEDKPRVIELKLDKSGLSSRVSEALKGADDAVNAETGAPEEKPEGKPEEEAPIDIEKIIQMAPFMSKAALEELIEKHSGRWSPRALSRLAPFVSSECLEKLIVDSESEINWETLRRLAPFLKKEVVDALTMAVAKGERYVRPAAKTISKSISYGINKAIEIAKSVSAQIPDMMPPEPPKAPNRASEARRRIFERALADGRFDWIANHMDQLEDPALKSAIAARARELGMNDWIQEHMEDLWDQATIDDALLAGNWDYIAEHLGEIDEDTLGMIAATALGEGRWDWLGDHLDEMDLPEEYLMTIATAAAKDGRWDWLGDHLDEMDLPEEFLMTIATAAADAGNWDWLRDHADEMELGGFRGELAIKAYRAGAREFVIELVDENADEMELDALVDAAIEKGDAAFVAEMVEHANEDAADMACLRLARAGHLDLAARLAENCSQDAVAELIDIATDAGDWDAIDKLNEHLD